MNKNLKTLKLCPHWIDEDGFQDCNISKGGLFMPMPQHIETFCLSEQHYKCSHFIRAYERMRELAQIETAADGDRRMNRRIDCNYLLYFYPLEEMRLHQKNKQKEAKSIDVSLGGMRINSFEEIPQQQVMAFSFGTDQEAASSIVGIGEVQWCREAPDQGYLAGVSFVSLQEDMKAKLLNCICSTPI